ncbi:MAG: 50S ribosome-binding GTPase, partial [Planctomycetes bacterium]|nr:50S ribosome-binding GTPase [Planctomycetota bacterium]
IRGMLKIAFVGKRNVGKSTIINYLSGDQRVIVSDTPGTTRDALDIIVKPEGQEPFVAIDTAGMRKRGQMADIMEFFGHVRTERAIRRADVVMLMLDAGTDISKVDKRLGALIVEECKPCIVVLNKWDLAIEQNPGLTIEAFNEYISDRLPGLWFCRIIGISALEGINVWSLIDSARELANLASVKAGTGAINSAIASAQKKRRPKPLHGKVGKIYYATQVEVSPPTFLLFCNNPKFFDKNYMRFIEGHMRDALGYHEVPLKLILKTSGEKEVGRYTP